MNLRAWCIVFVLLASLPGRGRGQPCCPPPRRGPAPLLYVRFLGPAGLRATFYQGRPQGRAYDAPVVVGLRPGYFYRVELSHLPGRPGVSVFPGLEVLGSLNLPPALSSAAYPAPVVLTETDVERALAGAMVTKVVYLEHPDRAVPTAARPDQPLETDLPPDRHLLAEARELGRPVLVVRLGGRMLSPEDLARQSAPGTILLPGERSLGPPSRPPCLPGACGQVYDPILGPRPPEEECLHDGGDRGLRAGLDADGQILGLDPEDTVAAYTDSHGRRRLSCSNRVCLCVPRFALLRQELPVGGYEVVLGPAGTRLTRMQEQIGLRIPSRQAQALERMRVVQMRERPSIALGTQEVGRLLRIEVLEAVEIVVGPLALIGTKEMERLTVVQRTRLARQLKLARELSLVTGVQAVKQTIGTAVVARVEGGPELIEARAETRDITVCCQEAPHCAPEKPLVLIKCADRHAAQVGDVVTFTLRYTNGGSRPLTDIAVADSLNPRLEYVPGSAQTDREAVFTMQDNGAGSAILRWEISGRLLPGQSGVVRFKVRVR